MWRVEVADVHGGEIVLGELHGEVVALRMGAKVEVEGMWRWWRLDRRRMFRSFSGSALKTGSLPTEP